jgi:two-component sensor histidine kinase
MLFVALALWWLLGNNGGKTVWIVREGALRHPGSLERFHAVFRGDLGLQRIYPWVLFGPCLALIAWYFPLERGRLRRSLPLNAAVCVAFLLACYEIDLRTAAGNAKVIFFGADDDSGPKAGARITNRIVDEVFGSSGKLLVAGGGPTNVVSSWPDHFKPPLPPAPSSKLSLFSTIMDLLAYGAILGLTHSVHFYRRFRERERGALLLESNLAKARLNALRAQLHPHFLFNSLNAITALLRRDPRLAEVTLTSLSELLRLALSQSERQEISLREELEFVQRYIEIQQTRFADKLGVEQEIDPAALDCRVPALVLQPLVENAIRHGIEPIEKAGLVRLKAHRSNGKLVLTVEDNGVGLTSEPSRNGNGIGLANLRARLATLYGARQALELISRPDTGVIARIEIPWNSSPATEEESAVLNAAPSRP